MKTRLALLVLFGLVAAYYFPDSRAAMAAAAKPALDPLYSWQSGHEMEEVARALRAHERENYGRLPDRRGWLAWLEENFHDDMSRDSWGTAYFFETQRDSFTITSAGPDRLLNTQDDLVRTSALLRAGGR